MTTKDDGDIERALFHQKLADSVEAQNNLMILDVAKVFDKMPYNSSVVVLRKFRGTILAGFAALDGGIMQTYKMLKEGILYPDRSPDWWKVIPQSKLDLLSEFINPPDAALAFFVLTPSGQYALAFSHIFRSDDNVQWVSDANFIQNVADVLVEAGLFQPNTSEK